VCLVRRSTYIHASILYVHHAKEHTALARVCISEKITPEKSVHSLCATRPIDSLSIAPFHKKYLREEAI